MNQRRCCCCIVAAMTARYHRPAAARWLGVRLIALLAAFRSLTCVPVAFAQAPPEGDPAAGSAAPAIKALGSLPRFRMEATKADRLPYTTWKIHLGPAAEAVVTASVTTINRKSGETTTKTGVGLVIRCDGFVLLPASLFPVSLFPRPGVPSVDRRQAADRVEAILLQVMPASQKGATEVAPPVPASFPATLTRYTAQSVPYVLVKAQNVHLPAAALLHPRNVASSGMVEVVFPRKESSDTAAPLTLQRLKARIAAQGDGTFGLTLDAGSTVSADALPAGAVVIDPAAKMVLGIIAPPLFPTSASAGAAAAGASPSASPAGASLPFQTFERFHDITNCVALVPAPDDRLNAAALASRPAGTLQEGMVWVPGGPLTVQADANPELEGASVACTPGFWIDQNEVTLGQYKAFMKATGYRPQSGVGLVDEKEGAGGAAAVHDDTLPVHGISLMDAEAYAAWKGNRLATPLEWQWASRGGDLLPVQSVPVATPAASRTVYLPLMQMDMKAFKLRQFDASVVRPGAAWADSYARALAEVERNTRVCMLLIGYNEANYWSHFRLWPKNKRYPVRTAFGGRGELKDAEGYANLPDFQAVVEQVTPSGTVRDSSYAQTLYNLGAFYELTMEYNGVSLFTYGYSILNAVMRPDLLQVAARLLTDLFDPVAIVPVRSHAYDRSMFDVRHTQTNVHEWLQPNYASGADQRAVKPLPPLFDPDTQPNWETLFLEESLRRLTAFNVAINNGNIFNPVAVGSRMVFSSSNPNTAVAASARRGPTVGEIFEVAAGKLDWETTTRNVSQFPTPLLPFVRIGHPEDAPDLGTGFRCAR